MPILNPTRRRAIFYGFLPLIALYLLYNFKLRHLIPSITTWPTERRIVEDLSDIARHKLMPWSFEHESDEFWEDEGEQFKDLVSARLPFSRHIVAVGDLHGDMPNARKVLTFAGVINEHGDWSGDVDFFVQTGDIIDRCVISLPSARCIHRFYSGDDTIPLFFFMERLRVQAAEVGGTVLSHLGNHEWMNAIGEFMLCPHAWILRG